MTQPSVYELALNYHVLELIADVTSHQADFLLSRTTCFAHVKVTVLRELKISEIF